ncbi:MAG: N-acetylglucosamine-6-phosphate deacetylase [Atopobiaceae bacterium]|nr:N-acetylglucosamine-6-phosphate deacetylase [Atopobiaceae bacterium]
MKHVALKADSFVLAGRLAQGGWLEIDGGCFVGWRPDKPSCEILDYGGCIVAPGFVDTHIHGFAGHDVMDCNPAGIDELCCALAQSGTTSWVPTTLTASAEQTEAACASVAESCAKRSDGFLGAKTQGIFLEGPFFTEEHKGAQNPAYMCDPSYELLMRWQAAAHGLIKKSALAPERSGSCDYIAQASRAGVVTAIGHTSASYDEAMRAVDAGASVFVHTFNGMDEISHRHPGVVGAALMARHATAELICDGVHVHPVSCELLIRTKGWEHVALISDALSCAGLAEGNYVLGELPIELRHDAAYLRDSGNLAGSTLTLAQAVKNVVAWGMVSWEQAIRMASEVPARSCGIQDVCGSIAAGRSADCVILTPNMELEATFVSGQRLP